QGDLGEGAVDLARVVVGADDVEGVILEGPETYPVPYREPAILAIPGVVDRLGCSSETVAMERAVDDRRDPPSGDRVLAQLEESGGHRQRVAAGAIAAAAETRSTSAAGSIPSSGADPGPAGLVKDLTDRVS